LAALLHGTPAAAASQTLRRGARNGITELSQKAPPIFGREAITLGIGPHSSYFYFNVLHLRSMVIIVPVKYLCHLSAAVLEEEKRGAIGSFIFTLKTGVKTKVLVKVKLCHTP